MGKDNRVQKIKRFLLIGPYIFILIPIIMCIVMIVLISRQNRVIDGIKNDIEDMKKSSEMVDYGLDSTQESINLLTEDLKSLTKSVEDISQRTVISSSVTIDRSNQEWPKRVYLTFDDGPSANTGKILDILDEYGVKGNFFVVGTESENLKKYYKRIVDEGHVLGMHSYSHKYSEIYASKDAFVADLDKIYTLIYDETGFVPEIYRFPGGSSNNVSRVNMDELVEILDKRGIVYYDWNVLSGDATNPILPVEDIIDNSLATVGEYEEAMILFHDLSNKTTTVEALPTIIEALLDNGITIAPIDKTTMLIQHNKNN